MVVTPSLPMHKPLILIGLTVVLALVGFSVLNGYIYQEKQATPTEIVEPYRGTLTGEYLCLPHVDQTGPQTMECALGIKTEAGEYYAVDFTLLSQEVPTIQTGDTFTATGLITPIENLSTDHWRKYPVSGIFSVTDSIYIK